MPKSQLAAARAVCARCPVSRDCFISSFQNDERHGIWAGFTTHDRRRTKRLTRSLTDALAHFDQGTLYTLVVKPG